MTTLTRERLEQLANFRGSPVTRQEEQELAKFKLAAMQQEPLYQVLNSGGWRDVKGDIFEALKAEGLNTRILYTAPPVPVMPDKVIARIEHEANHVTPWHHMDEHSCKVNRRDLLTLVNACRAAMLQGKAEDVSTVYKLDGGENCWSCGKYFTYEQHSECDGYCPHCDSPVDLDDEEDKPSKVVPNNPTEEMISNAWREAIGKCDHETIKRIYATMLAAAPQQEVNP